MIEDKLEIPKTGFAGLKQNWKSDIIAALSVALVALPLSLAIAVAMGIPPISGLITAAIGGIVATIFRSSFLTIQGPGAGLIGVVIATVAAMDDGCGPAQAFRYALAAFIVAGIIQVFIGLFRYGRIADLFPTTVIHGILASIGIIIFAKQAHVAMGTESHAHNTIGIIEDIFAKIPDANPYILVISGIGLILLLFHARISYKVFHFIPAPVWVLAIAVPIVILYNYLETNNIAILGTVFKEPHDYLIGIPDNWMDGILFPDFSKAYTPSFWLSVISITLLSSVISLAGAKAIDKLDPYKRKTDLNKDLVAIGLSTIASGALGGIPVMSVIVRSTVNVHNNAKTKWSNFYHGLLIILFLLLMTPIIQLFPKAALASVLLVTGIKLASPKLFKEIYNQGLEQIIFLISTIVITLYRDPLSGIIGGMGITLIAHLLISRLSVPAFIQALFNSGTEIKELDDGTYLFNIKGIANFILMLRLSALLEKVPPGRVLRIDLSKSLLVDLTFQEKLLEFRRKHRETGGRVQIVGLERHIATSSHKLALKSLILPLSPKTTQRMKEMAEMAERRLWKYTREEQADTSDLYDFKFFRSRPLESKENIISSRYTNGVEWELGDIIFDEGAMLAKETYKTTIELIHLNGEFPSFVLENEGVIDKWVDRVLSISGQTDIDFEDFERFSSRYRLTGADPEAIRNFFKPEIIRYLEEGEAFHIESNGRDIIIFRGLKNARVDEVEKMVDFAEGLIDLIKKQN